MKKIGLFVTLWTILVLSACAATEKDQSTGDAVILPEFDLQMPRERHIQEYLGVSGESPFTVRQVKAEVVIIKLFSVHCPLCHKDAPKINQLYADIEHNAALKGKVKLIAIGAGNSASEVKRFKDKYRLQFPVFSDEDATIHHQLGDVRFPYYIGVKNCANEPARIIYSQLGQITDPDKFVKLILRRSEDIKP